MDGAPIEQEEESSDDDAIRVVALGVVRREGTGETELLVSRHRDPATGDRFYRPLGGGVEFGEHSADALRREFREELGVPLEHVSDIGTYEDVFTHDGEPHHELWRIYEVEIGEDWPYEEESFVGYESGPDGEIAFEADDEAEREAGEEIECVWKPVAGLGPEASDRETFYPGTVLSEL